MRAGGDPNFRASKEKASLDMTPLTWCIYAGYTDAVRLFLSDSRTDVNIVVRQEDGGYITALDIAYKIGDVGEKIVDLLITANAKRYGELFSFYGSKEKIPSMP